jgi:hypothetical protein
MSGTVVTDLNAISLTSSAKAAASIKGVDLSSVIALAKSHAIELKALLQQILNVHPSTGGDASNYAALQTIISELA